MKHPITRPPPPIQLRVTADERALLEQKAKDAGKGLSEYLRQAGMERPLRSKVAAEILNDLRLLAMDVKRLARESGKHEKEHLDTLKAIQTAMQKIWDKRVQL